LQLSADAPGGLAEDIMAYFRERNEDTE